MLVSLSTVKLTRAAWEEVEEALSIQQARRVTDANLTILIEMWGVAGGGLENGEAEAASLSPCVVFNVVIRAIQSWQKFDLQYLDRRGAGCDLGGIMDDHGDKKARVVESAPLAGPDIYVRVGRKFTDPSLEAGHGKARATSGDVEIQSVSSPNIGRLYSVLLLLDKEISAMAGRNSSSQPPEAGAEAEAEAGVEEFAGVEQVIVFSDNAKGAGASGRGTRNLASLFTPRKNIMPPALSLLSEPKTGNEIDIISALNTSFVSGVLDAQYRRYTTANLAIMRSQLSWSSSIAMQNSRRSPSARRILKAVAIIVEPRVVPTFEFSVRNVMHHLLRSSSMSDVQWKLHVYSSPGPSGNERFVKSVLSDMPSSLVKFIRLPRTFDREGGRGYNQLFKSSGFWRRLITYGFSTALIFQADSLIVDSSRLGEYLKYDLVGAPWKSKTSNSAKNEESPVYRLKCCNGGLSLRRIKAMYQIASEKRSLNPDFNEDVYFSSYAEEFGLALPESSHASNFSLEMPPQNVNYHVKGNHANAFRPLGLHAAWAYNDPVFIEDLFKRSCTNLNVQCDNTMKNL